MASMQPLHAYYFVGTLPTNIGSLIVIICYICTPELRHNHSVFIFYRCFIDLALGICLSFLFIVDQITPPDTSTSAPIPDTEIALTDFYHAYCEYLGPLTQFLYLSLIGYFLALIGGLHTSIANPFASPNHFNITKTNAFIYLIAAGITVLVKCTRDFYYNLDAQLCLIDNAHIMYYYLPLCLTLLYGIYVAISTFYRLRKGLPNTFRVRKKMIRDVWSFCIIFVIYTSCLAVTYCLTIIPSTSDHEFYHYLYAITLSVFGVPDFIVFMIINLDIFRRCIPCYCCCYEEDIAINPNGSGAEASMFGSTTISSMTAFTKTDLLKPLHPKQLSLLDDFHVTPNRKLLRQLTAQKQAKRSCLKKCWKRMGISMREDHQPKALNDTLRREILAYTTDGIAQSVDKCNNEILSDHAYPESINDFRPNVINRFDVKIQNNWALGRGQNVITMNLCRCCCKRSDDEHNSKEQAIPIADREKTPTDDLFIDILNDDDDEDEDEEEEEDEQGLNEHDEEEKLSAYFSSKPRVRKRASMPRSSFSINTFDGQTSHDQIATTRYSQKHMKNMHFVYPKHRVFVDYAPLVFKHIREKVLGIDSTQYKASIIPSTSRLQLKMLKKCKFGEGRSGAFFYITHDSKFVVKTVRKREVNSFLEILSDYKQYLDDNRQTIFSRCVGLHSLTFYGLTLYFLVMENVFAAKLKPTET